MCQFSIHKTVQMLLADFVKLKSMAVKCSTLATIIGHISQNDMQLADYAFLWV